MIMIIQKTPWLKYGSTTLQDTRNTYSNGSWIFCADALHELFVFPRGSQIQLVAYLDRQEDSYMVEFKNESSYIESKYFSHMYERTLKLINNTQFYFKLFYKEYSATQ